MTLHEIEETLGSLSSRHPHLDEGVLVTLLRAGGWEEKDIRDAIIIFRGGSLPVEVAPQPVKAITVGEEPPKMLPDGIGDGVLLSDHNETVPVVEMMPQTLSAEPESLVPQKEELPTPKKEELPHNLPLRPFETSDHIWSFSRYRDVFFGEDAPPVQAKNPEPPQQVKGDEPATVPRIGTFAPAKDVERSSSQSAHMDAEEKLVMLAAAMLLVVLLLLGYMYGNGRL